MAIGIIDLNYFALFSVSLILAEGHKVGKNETGQIHFLANFSSDQDGLDMILKQFKVNVLVSI